jgi:hypothetical protein
MALNIKYLLNLIKKQIIFFGGFNKLLFLITINITYFFHFKKKNYETRVKLNIVNEIKKLKRL